MTHPPKLWLAETAIWWGSSKPYIAGRLQVTVVRESRLDHCWGNFGARFSEASAWALCAQVLWEDTRGQDLWHLPRLWKSPGGRLMLWDSRKLGLRQRSRMTHEESRGKAYVVGQWEAGTRCTDLGWTVLWEDTGRATYRWFEERKSVCHIYV